MPDVVVLRAALAEAADLLRASQADAGCFAAAADVRALKNECASFIRCFRKHLRAKAEEREVAKQREIKDRRQPYIDRAAAIIKARREGKTWVAIAREFRLSVYTVRNAAFNYGKPIWRDAGEHGRRWFF